MIASIHGELLEVSEEGIVVEAAGVGYNIMVPGTVLSELPRVGQEVRIYTHLSVREDAMKLYGFLDREELEIFRLLIGVSGIGPKGALGILTALTVDELRIAVLTDDLKTIGKAPGIGKKTTQKLILELKDRMKLVDEQFLKTESSAAPAGSTETGRDEAIQALMALGYSSSEALHAIRSVELGPEATAEEWIRESLRFLS